MAELEISASFRIKIGALAESKLPLNARFGIRTGVRAESKLPIQATFRAGAGIRAETKLPIAASFGLRPTFRAPAIRARPISARFGLRPRLRVRLRDSRKVAELLQRATVGAPVTLFEIDARHIGGPLYHFTPSPLRVADGVVTVEKSEPVSFGGTTYLPWPCKAEGFEWSGRGPQPTPSLVVSAVVPLFTAAVIAYDGMRGAFVTRIRTFARYLDSGEEPDEQAHLPLDIYRIDRVAKMDPRLYVEFELAAATDQEGVMLPRRQVLRDICTHSYRVWNAETETFIQGTCPYVGNQFFRDDGTSTADPAQDRCSKRLENGCVLRFGRDPLPTRAFPGVGRSKI